MTERQTEQALLHLIQAAEPAGIYPSELAAAAQPAGIGYHETHRAAAHLADAGRAHRAADGRWRVGPPAESPKAAVRRLLTTAQKNRHF